MTAIMELRHPHKGPAVVRLTLEGSRLVREFGREGRLDHHTVETAASEDAARVRRDRVARRLIARGYVIGQHHPGLIEVIAAAPDEPEGYLVYADWLARHDDPRAALIHATLEPKSTGEIRPLLERHAVQFVKPEWWDHHLVWWMGFIRGFESPWGVGSPLPAAPAPRVIANPWIVGQLERLRRHPSGRFVRWLRARQYHRGIWRSVAGPITFEKTAPVGSAWRVHFDATVEPFRLDNMSVASLRSISGIGRITAERIIAYRDTHGPLRSVLDLRAVRGIGPATLTRLTDALVT